MDNHLRSWLLFGIICVALLSFSSIAAAKSASIDQKLYSELLKFPTDKKIVEVDGVPCLRIFLPKGQSISYFCHFVEYFDHDLNFYRQRIALINRLEPMAIFGGTDSLSTEVKFIYVPLNFSILPQVLPEYIEAISELPQYILIDVGQQCLGLYENGSLVQLFPISSGKHGTPTRSFVLLSKEKNHYSKQYDNAWMPYSMRLFAGYFIHGGILPSYPASHGCVRMIYENAVVVYNWAKVGTPGEIINDRIQAKNRFSTRESG